MRRLKMGSTSAGTAILTMILASVVVCVAQEPAPETTQDSSAPTPKPLKADGERRGLPLETYAVAPGTKFLVRLEDELNTKGTQENAKFKVKTLEPLEAGSGIYLPPGAEIHGHISRVEPAGVAGRAKLWLTFDEIRTKFGKLPIVAEVVSVPGDHSVKSGPTQEGLIEGRSSTQHDAAESAAAGAAIGAVRGVKDKNKKEAAEGAALGALTAYLMESGRGHELNLPKGAKLELELERALYLVKE
jgi:YMGG-like Gly-zipper